MVDYIKVARIVRRLREFKSKQVTIPQGDSIKGSPCSASNNNETPGVEEDPNAHNTPKDVGFDNQQTISGTGSGSTLG
jgi:hypothetical protein